MPQNGEIVEFSSPFASRMGRWRAANTRRDGGGGADIKRLAGQPHLRFPSNEIKNAVQLVAYNQGPNTDHTHSLGPAQPGRSPSVVCGLLLAVVRRPIDLDRQLRGRAIEVEDVWTKRVLLSKPKPGEPVTLKPDPQSSLRRRQLPPKPPRPLIADPVRHNRPKVNTTLGYLISSPSQGGGGGSTAFSRRDEGNGAERL
jgi:hypothetical protein